MSKEIEKPNPELEDKIAELELQGIKVEEVESSDDVPTGWRRVKQVGDEKINYGLKRSTVAEDDTAILYQVAPFGGVEKETTFYVWRHGGLEPQRDKERYKEIRKKLFTVVNEALKPLGFKRHRTRRSTWWRKRGDSIQAINFQHSKYSRSYMVNLSIYKASRIEDIESHHLEMGERMDNFFVEHKGDETNYEGRVKIDQILNFESIQDEYEGEAPEDAQIAEFKRILEGFIPLIFEIPSNVEVNRKSVIALLIRDEK